MSVRSYFNFAIFLALGITTLRSSVATATPRFTESSSATSERKRAENLVPSSSSAQAIDNAIHAVFRSYRTSDAPLCGRQQTKTQSDTLYFYNSSADIQAFGVKVIKHSIPNAFAISAERAASGVAMIAVSSALLRKVKGTAQLSFVLAHELSHLEHHHVPEDPMFVALLGEEQRREIVAAQTNWELVADADAIRALAKAGLNTTAAINLLAELEEFETENAVYPHPALSERIIAAQSVQRSTPLALAELRTR